MSDTALMTAEESSLIERMQACKWANQMTILEKRMLAGLARTYGLDPLMGELIWYESKPLIALDGHIRIATRNPKYEGIDARPMTEDEKEAYGLVNQPYAWICYAYKTGMRAAAIGIGTADPNKPHRSKQVNGEWVGGNIVERERPWTMARARAINQALRLYFPHNIPGAVSDVDADITVDKAGNVIDGTFRSVPVDEPQAPAQAEVTEVPSDVVTPPKATSTEGEPLFAPDPDPVVEFFGARAEPPPPPTARDLTLKRIDDLLAKINRTRDDGFFTYFATYAGVEWDKATDEQLDRFLSHMADVHEEAKTKKHERARSR